MARSRRPQDPKRRYEFATHRFKGKRFADNTLDVDALHELLAYKKLILETATHLARNDQKKKPRGLARGFDLAIKATREGCFDVALVHSATTMPLFAQHAEHAYDIYTRARDYVTDIIRHPERQLPSPEMAKAWAAYGAHLNDDEEISHFTPGTNEPVSYTRLVRATILKAQNAEYQDAVDIEGEVRSVILDQNWFEIKATNGLTIGGNFDPEDAAKFARALGAHRFAHAHVIGQGLYAPDGTLKSITTTESVKIVLVVQGQNVRDMAIDKQMSDLMSPQDLGDGLVVTVDDLCAANVGQILHEMTDEAQLPLPYLYATAEGGVQAEWSIPPMEVICEFKDCGQSADTLAVNVDTGASFTSTTHDLGQSGAVETLISWIRTVALPEVAGNE